MRLFARALISLLVVLASSVAMVAHAFDRELPVIAHYGSEFARVGFVLDRSSELPRLKFDGTEEILVLRWLPAAGGDRLLERDDHVIVLRISSLGGITLFTPANMGGTPVAPDRVFSQPLLPVVPSIAVVRDVTSRIMAQLRAETGRDFPFEADWNAASVDVNYRGLLFDSVRNAGSAVINTVRSGGRAGLMNNLRRVRFVPAGGPGAFRQGDMLVVTFAIGQGLGGRPSSFAVTRQLAQFAR